MMRNREQRKLKTPVILTALVSVFFFAGFFLLYLMKQQPEALVFAFAVPAVIWLGMLLIPRFIHADPPLLILTYFLCCVGVLTLFDLKPEWGIQQFYSFLIANLGMIAAELVVAHVRRWAFPCFLLMAVSVALLSAPAVFGRTINGAKAWLAVGSFSFQPSEPVKLCFLLVMAFVLSRRKVLLAVLFGGGCLLLLMMEKDLGTALLYFFTAMLLIYASTGSLLLMLGGLTAGGGAAYIGYRLFSHVQARVSIWLDPFADPQGKGYQLIHGLFAIVNGGLWGKGLGQGNAGYIPYVQNDFIFAAIVNEFGILFGFLLLAAYVLIIIRGAMIARRSADMMHALLAIGCVGMIALQSFVIVGGIVKLIPLTGITLPFISQGGSSMVSSMAVIGLLQGVAARNEQILREDETMAYFGQREAGQ